MSMHELAPRAELAAGALPARAEAQPRHYDFIDALRGVAILGVVVFHASLEIDGLPRWIALTGERGSSGVQLFYALSAFTLCASFHARGHERGAVGKYFLRRIFRIVPMFWAAIAFFSVVTCFATHWGPPHWPDPELTVLTALLLHGFNIYALNGVVPGGWSVAVESQFYLLLPLIFLAATSLRRVALMIAVALVVSVLYMPLFEYVFLTRLHHPDPEDVHQFAYFSLPVQMPVFLMGVLAYRLLGPDRARLDALAARVPLRPLAIVVSLLLIFPFRHSVPGHHGYGIMSLLLIYLLATGPVPLLDNRVTRFWGKISYSAYLLHFGGLFLLVKYVWLGPTPVVRIAVLEVAALAITALLASATHALIEEPGMALGRRVTRRLYAPHVAAAPAVVETGPLADPASQAAAV